jgi:hypothetical protein
MVANYTGPLYEKAIEKTKGQPGEIHFTRAEYKCLRAIARGYNRKHGTRLPAAHAIVRTLTGILEHPVKFLKCGSVEEQGQLAPSDLLPVRLQFHNTRQD